MNTTLRCVLLSLALLAGVFQAAAQQIAVTAFSSGSLSWTGAALNTTCRVQQAYSLSSGWTTLQSVLVTNNTMTTTVPLPTTPGSSVFYRIFGTPAPVLVLEIISGPSGTEEQVSGSGFRAGEQVNVYYGSVEVATATANSMGFAGTFFIVPVGQPLGTYIVTATGVTSGLSASTPFDQIAVLSLSPDSGPPGTSVTAFALGFMPGETINFYFHGAFDGSATANSGGVAGIGITVPYGEPPGWDYAVTAIGATSGESAAATFEQAPALTLSPSSGPAGTNVTAQANGFLPGETINIYYGSVSCGSTIADGNGNASVLFTIPFGQPNGDSTVTATGATSGASATATFEQAAVLTLSPSSGPPGTNVSAQASGFLPGETINFSYGSVSCGSATADSNGNASVLFTVPYGQPPGDNTVTARGATDGASAMATFEQASVLTLSPDSGPPGTNVTAKASGFQPSETVYFYYGSVPCGSATADSNGNATVTFTVPYGQPPGDNTVSAEGASSGIFVEATFDQTPMLTLSPSSGPPGTSVAANASGFEPEETIYFYYGNVPCGSTTSDSNGSATVMFAVPYGQPDGDNTVSAEGASSGIFVEATFDQEPPTGG